MKTCQHPDCLRPVPVRRYQACSKACRDSLRAIRRLETMRLAQWALFPVFDSQVRALKHLALDVYDHHHIFGSRPVGPVRWADRFQRTSRAWERYKLHISKSVFAPYCEIKISDDYATDGRFLPVNVRVTGRAYKLAAEILDHYGRGAA